MCTSNDGKLVATGDNYRYIYVFNTESKEEVGCYPYHKSAIIFMEIIVSLVNGDQTTIFIFGVLIILVGQYYSSYFHYFYYFEPNSS